MNLQEYQNQENKNSVLEKEQRRFLTPSANVYETEEETRIILHMPGVDENSVDISYDKEILSIEGKNSYQIPEGFESIHLEFKTGDYLRKFSIRKPIDFENSKAVMKNGKLTLSLSKIKPIRKRIEVKSE
jgi:HSP20 family protein